jgi:hypothetical protein
MSNTIFHLPDTPSDESIRLLTLNLRSDSETKGVSAKNYAHRSRVIRQQTELLARRPLSLPTGQHRPFTVFRSAAEEVGTKAAHDVMDNEGAQVRSTD